LASSSFHQYLYEIAIDGHDAQGTIGRDHGEEERARYAVEGVASCDPDDPNDVGRAIVADIKQAIWSGDITFGRRVVSIDYRGRTIAPREDGAAMVSAAVEFSLSFAETLASGG